MAAFITAVESTASPRLYRRHQRHAVFGRLRYSSQAREFLAVQSARLASHGYEATLFGKLLTNTAPQISVAANIGALL